MIDIYDEVGYIKEVLEHGLSYRWTRDLTLLTKYYHLEGMKKSEVKELLKKKCERYVDGYNPFTSYRIVNNVFEKAWSNKTPLREIKVVRIPKDVVKWFLALEDEKISNEELEKLEFFKRYKISLKNNIYTFNRVKLLFTLYVWGLIQGNFLDFPWSVNISKYTKKLKEDSHVTTSFKMIPECNLLYDLGKINITMKRNIIIKFIDEDIFKKEYKDSECYFLTGDDLYNCGYWLEKQKMGTFICQHCGKEFAHYSFSKQEKGRKYCKECSNILANHKFDGDKKIIICEDCGKEVEVDKTDVKTTRCYECQDKINREKTNQRVKNFYEKHGR